MAMQMAMRLATADDNGHDDGAVELLAGIETRTTRMWQCERCDCWCSDERCGWCGAHRPPVRGG